MSHETALHDETHKVSAQHKMKKCSLLQKVDFSYWLRSLFFTIGLMLLGFVLAENNHFLASPLSTKKWQSFCKTIAQLNALLPLLLCLICFLGALRWEPLKKAWPLLNTYRKPLITALIIVISWASSLLEKSFFDFAENNLLMSALWWTTTFLLCYGLSGLTRLVPSDTPQRTHADIDKLNHQYYASKLGAMLVDKLTTAPESLNRIALTGSWGRGKTDLFLRLQHQLKEHQPTPDNPIQFKTHIVSAWNGSSAQETHTAILEGIDRALGLPKIKWSILRKFVEGVLSLLGAPKPSSQLIEIAKNGYSLSHKRNALEALDETLEDRQIRVVVFVDDIERASSETIQKVFPSLNNLKQLKNCCFIFAIDPDQLEMSYQSKDKVLGYMQKIFDAQFVIPLPNEREIERLVTSIVTDQESFLYQSLDQLKEYYPQNPRHLKKWLTMCKYKEDMFFKGVWTFNEQNFPAFFLKELLFYEFPELVNAITTPEQIEQVDERLSQITPDPVRLALNAPKEDSEKEADNHKIKESLKDLSAISTIDPLLKNPRGRHLFEGVLKLANDSDKYTRPKWLWLLGDYAKFSSLSDAHLDTIIKLFIENPEEDLVKYIKQVFAGKPEPDLIQATHQVMDGYFNPELFDYPSSKSDQKQCLDRIEILTRHIDYLNNHSVYYSGYLNGRFDKIKRQFSRYNSSNDSHLLLKLVTEWSKSFNTHQTLYELDNLQTGGLAYNIISPRKIKDQNWFKPLKAIYANALNAKVLNWITEPSYSNAINSENRLNVGQMTENILWHLSAEELSKELECTKQHIAPDFIKQYLNVFFYHHDDNSALDVVYTALKRNWAWDLEKKSSKYLADELRSYYDKLHSDEQEPYRKQLPELRKSVSQIGSEGIDQYNKFFGFLEIEPSSEKLPEA